MATQTVMSLSVSGGLGTVTLVATYTETETNVTVTSLRLANSNAQTYSISATVIFDGTSVNMSGGSSATASISKSYAKGTTSQSKTVSVTNLHIVIGNPSGDHQEIDASRQNRTFYISALRSFTVSYNSNGHGNAPAAQTKYYGVNIALRATIPTAAGYTFHGWATSSSATTAQYQPSSTYSANANITLYAVWTKAHANPYISSMTVIRCNASGTASDSGTYFKVTARWSIDTSISGNSGTISGQYKRSTAGTWTSGVTFTTTQSGTSWNSTAIVSGISTDYQYDIKVTVTDTGGYSTSRQDVLTRAKFTLDFGSGGNSMGVGSAAPESGLEVGWASQFDENVKLLKNLEVVGTITNSQLALTSVTSGVFSAGTNLSVDNQVLYKYGPILLARVVLKTTVAISSGSLVTLGSFTNSYRPTGNTCVVSSDFGYAWMYSAGTVSLRALGSNVAANQTITLFMVGVRT